MKIGLGALLTALFFVIVAGGHVSLDARPESPAALGVVVTLAAAVCAFLGVTKLQEKDLVPGALLIGLATLGVVADPLVGGDMLATVRTLVAVLTFGGLAYVIGTHRVVQMPTGVYAGCLALLVASMGVSILVSEFKWVSADAWIYWLTYGAAFYLTIAVVGRQKGPRLVLEVILFAATLVAIKGIVESLAMRSIDPTHRIFADWNNPNALAGLLAIAVPLAIGLAMTSQGKKQAVTMVAGGLLVAALAFTQSKGGLVVLPIGIVVLLVTVLLWRKKGEKLQLLSFAVPLAVAALLVLLVQFTTPRPQGGGAPLARVTATSTEQAQSLTYRKLLWQGTIQLAKRQPVGYGAGTFRYYSAQPGLNEQTFLSHQSFLQIAMEGGWIAFIGIVGLAIVWSIRMFAGARALDSDRNILRASVFAAIVTAAANGFLESNIFYLGTGFLVFVLLGLGLQLAADGTSPESMPAAFRGFIIASCCVPPLVFMVWVQWVENAKTSVYNAISASDRTGAEQGLGMVASVGALDGSSWYLRALLQPEGPDRVTLLQRAVALAPTTRYFRSLADAQAESGDGRAAVETLNDALAYDPNNLRTLKLKLDLEDELGDTVNAIETAKRIVAVEQTPYLQIRALPEYVPTEPLEARVYLANHSEVQDEQIRLICEALDGYLRYKALTVPRVKAFAKDGLDFAGDGIADAERKLSDARAVAEELIARYLSSDRVSEAEEVRELAAGLTVD